MGQAEELARFVTGIRFDQLPGSVLAAGKRGILDCLGTALGGAQSEAAKIAAAIVDEAGGRPQASLLGRGTRASLVDAALVNATAAHALDYDDTLSAPAAMASLAIGEYRGLPGKDLLTAYILGFEVASRMAHAIGGWDNSRGWHMMGVAGVFGAATSAAYLLRLNADQTAQALGLATSQSAGLVAMHGFLAKPFHSGKAAANGVFAAQLAMHGCTSGPALEGKKSLFHAMGGDPEAQIAKGLGSSYAILENRLKPFPCGRLGHAAIEAALKLRSAHRLDSGEILSVQVGVNPKAQYLMGGGDPQTGTEGMFSISHGVAAALVTGKAGPAEFSDEAVRDPSIAALRWRVEVISDGEKKPGQAAIEARTRDGLQVAAEVAVQKGLPQNPLTDSDVREKFLSLADPILGPEQSRKVVEIVFQLETLANAQELVALCC